MQHEKFVARRDGNTHNKHLQLTTQRFEQQVASKNVSSFLNLKALVKPRQHFSQQTLLCVIQHVRLGEGEGGREGGRERGVLKQA